MIARTPRIRPSRFLFAAFLSVAMLAAAAADARANCFTNPPQRIAPPKLLDGRHRIRFEPAQDVRLVVDRSLAFDGNAVRFLARNTRGDILASRLYFSTGSGAVLAEEDAGAAPQMPRIPYPYATADELLAVCRTHAKRIPDLVRANECALHSPGEVRAGLLLVAQAMGSAVERGLTTEGVLPGGARRTAPSWSDALLATDGLPPQRCAVYATAVAEENAAGGRVVAAPSSGAAGPVAALLQHWRDSGSLQQDDRAIDFLLAGAAVGGLLRCAGVTQVGCQGEVGVAAAMAAAGYATVLGASNAQILHAAERALEPHLGLACDPAGGRIQDPCIERNAVASVKAITAARLALYGDGRHTVSLDKVIKTMMQTGADMKIKYKETSRGGLAVNIVEC